MVHRSVSIRPKSAWELGVVRLESEAERAVRSYKRVSPGEFVGTATTAVP
jgi:hypothetical protein